MIDQTALAPVVTMWLRDTLPLSWESSGVFDAVGRQVRTTRQQRRHWPPLAMPRRGLVVAGVAAALSIGVVVTGLPPQRPTDRIPAGDVSGSSTPTVEPTVAPSHGVVDDLVPGVALVTEEVEPGVFRIVNDGVRDLARPRPFYDYADHDFHVAAGLDGSVWLLGPDGSGRARRHGIEPVPGQADFFRLGAPTSYPFYQPPYGPTQYGDVEVGPGGAMWMVADGLFHIDDWECQDCGDWPGPQWRQESGDARLLAMQRDGTVVVFSKSLDVSMLSTLRGDQWSTAVVSTGAPEPGGTHLWVTDAGDTWLWTADDHRSLARYDGARWWPLAMPDRSGGRYTGIGRVDVGRDGTIWAQLDECVNGDCGYTGAALARYDGGGWMLFDESDGVPNMRGYELPEQLRVADDGTVWVNPVSEWESPNPVCGGLHHFDGATWQRYLDGICIYDMDIAVDGTVWFRGGTFDLDAEPFGSATGPVELYAIRPG